MEHKRGLGPGLVLAAAILIESSPASLAADGLRSTPPSALDACADLAARAPAEQPTADTSDLPLIEVPTTDPSSSPFLAVVVSGAGGWAGLDRSVAQELARSGIPAVGLDSRHYLWTRQSADDSGVALTRILCRYRQVWSKDRFVLVGYSLGASMLPFMVSRLPADLRRQVALVALVGPDATMDFKFHLTDLLGGSSHSTALGVASEIAKLTGTSVLCVYGETETDSLCARLDSALSTPVRLPGGHHFWGDYAGVAKVILGTLGRG